MNYLYLNYRYAIRSIPQYDQNDFWTDYDYFQG
jgi:hypothetical protein